MIKIVLAATVPVGQKLAKPDARSVLVPVKPQTVEPAVEFARTPAG